MGQAIAIDGPAGAGKSTVAKKVAEKLGFLYVDTGAMYRAMALYFLNHHIDMTDAQAVGEACCHIDIAVRHEDGIQQVYLNSENVTAHIRSEEAGTAASKISKYVPVREKLLELQRHIAASCDVIMDGRDIGTCVLPQAQLKVYLTASVSERAKRRYLELQEKGVLADLKEVEQDIRTRDDADMHRAIAPLRQAEDAVLVDSSHMEIEDAVQEIISIFHQKLK